MVDTTTGAMGSDMTAVATEVTGATADTEVEAAAVAAAEDTPVATGILGKRSLTLICLFCF